MAGGAVRLCRALATDAAEKGATATTRRFRQHVNPLAAQYREPMELPEWSTAFANPSLPIHLDIGCVAGQSRCLHGSYRLTVGSVRPQVRKRPLSDAGR